MKKRIKKKYEMLERIEYLEDVFAQFVKDTTEVIEILVDKIEHKH